jgi:transcriptional regulator with XRE-family HTH domain
MSNPHQLLQIRNKKLGLLIMDARRSLRKSVEECAEAAGVSPEQFQEFEKGASAPSLPQLEMLALFFNLPLEHFWGHRALTGITPPEAFQDKDRLLLLRNRVIGTNLRLARNNASSSYQDVYEKTGVSEDDLKRYELGETAVPTPILEILASTYNTPIEQFYDQHGPIGKWRSQQGNMQRFLDLPPDLQQFISKPVNRPYLELAMRLSDLSVEKLRAVAEVLLEITY